MANYRKNHKQTNYGSRLAVRVSDATKKRLLETVRQQGISETELIRSLIDEYLQKHDSLISQ